MGPAITETKVSRFTLTSGTRSVRAVCQILVQSHSLRPIGRTIGRFVEDL